MLPDGAVRLAGNDFTRVQSVGVKQGGTEFWGLQYHPEYNPHEMARLIFCRLEKLVKLKLFAAKPPVWRTSTSWRHFTSTHHGLTSPRRWA
ncbi:MAG: hypothetical protein Ct9H300mP32_2230 [Verrucomicrobiota bacterium]|nr:MAG: hypothetical protein Ct9H300mP32_2230 [Verrucomicrobiota bacterium]